MPFSPCEQVIDRISAVLDGEITGVGRLRFQAHLMMCAPCRRYYEQFLAVRELGAEPAESDLPEDFADVMAFVLDAVEQAEAPAPPEA